MKKQSLVQNPSREWQKRAQPQHSSLNSSLSNSQSCWRSTGGKPTTRFSPRRKLSLRSWKSTRCYTRCCFWWQYLLYCSGWAHCRWRHTELHQSGTVAPGRTSNYDDDGSGKFLKLEDSAGHVLQNLMKRNVLTQFFYTWLAWLWSSGQPWIVYVHGLRW